MSRNTVARLLMLQEPPRYAREGRASILDPYRGEIAALLDEDAKAPATVILERLRRLGYRGGITILKDHLACVRVFAEVRRQWRRRCRLSRSRQSPRPR